MAHDLRKRCFEFGVSIINLADQFPQKRSAWIIADQLIRSATSIGANLTEAKGSGSRLEYKRFFQIALKSANETIYWIEMCKSVKIVPATQIDVYLQEAVEIAKMVGSAVIKLQKPQGKRQ